MSNNRIEEIGQQILALQQRRTRLIARQAAADRQLRTRQTIIIGAWLMANQPALVEVIKTKLERPQDLAAFGMVKPSHDVNPADVTPETPEDPHA